MLLSIWVTEWWTESSFVTMLLLDDIREYEYRRL
jgi:hypothetical protein